MQPNPLHDTAQRVHSALRRHLWVYLHASAILESQKPHPLTPGPFESWDETLPRMGTDAKGLLVAKEAQKALESLATPFNRDRKNLSIGAIYHIWQLGCTTEGRKTPEMFARLLAADWCRDRPGLDSLGCDDITLEGELTLGSRVNPKTAQIEIYQ